MAMMLSNASTPYRAIEKMAMRNSGSAIIAKLPFTAKLKYLPKNKTPKVY